MSHRRRRRKVTSCGKTRYRDQRLAIACLHEIVAARRMYPDQGSGPYPVRAYWCQQCHGWHLTKLDKSEFLQTREGRNDARR